MDMVVFLKLLAILLLVIGNAFFVGSEVAITAARRSRIKQLADMGNKRAAVVKLLHDEPTRFYAVTQIGITLVSMALGYVGMETINTLVEAPVTSMMAMFGDSPYLTKVGGWVSITLAFIIISFLHVVGGELAPKVLAYHKSEQMSIALGWIINFLYHAMRPIIWVMNLASNYLLIACGQGDIVGDGAGGHGHDSSAMSVEEIILVVNGSASSGNITKDQGRMMLGIFDLDEETAQQAMVPKPDVHGLEKGSTIGDALTYFANTNHRRYPVFEGDKVIGVVPIKKLIHVLEGNKEKASELMNEPISSVMRDDPFVVPASTKLSQVMKDLKTNRRQFGIVVDEYGSMIGVITPERIISRLVGEYNDEFAPKSTNIKKLVGSQWEILGGVRVADLELILNFPFPTDASYVTVGGLMFKNIGRVPEVGDVVEFDGARMQILEMDNLRIKKVLFQDLAKQADGAMDLAEKDSPADTNGDS